MNSNCSLNRLGSEMSSASSPCQVLAFRQSDSDVQRDGPSLVLVSDNTNSFILFRVG